MMRKSASGRLLLQLGTFTLSILPSYQIHLEVAFSCTTKIKIAWQVVNMLIIQVILLDIGTLRQLLIYMLLVLGHNQVLPRFTCIIEIIDPGLHPS